MLTTAKEIILMENSCLVNKKSVKNNKDLKSAQKKARKYYQEKLFEKAPNATKAKIRKIADLSEVEYKAVSELELSGDNFKTELSRDELISLCKEGNLTGRSGNGFETYKKLEAFHKENGTLIINAVECDPGLVSDSWLYRNKQNLIIQGADIIKNALGINKVILATKEPLMQLGSIKQIKVIDRFPMGYENYLIKYVLGISLGDNELPQDKGILILNLQTVIAIAEMTHDIKASEYKYITAANLFTSKSYVVRAHIGDKVQDVLEKCLSQEINLSQIYAGGGALNCHKVAEDEIIENTTCYLAIGAMPGYEDAGKCKGCKACTKNCSAGVEVHKIVQYVDKNGMNHAKNCESFSAVSCIGCGACTYGCMARKDVRKVVRWAKLQKTE